MKYFTRKYISGGISDQKRHAAYDAYSQYISHLGLSPALVLLARLNLHDARILAIGEGCTLKIRLRHGDLRRGYVSGTLTFSQVAITKKSMQLLRDAVQPSHVDILATELEKVDDASRFRLLLWPRGEVAIMFKHVVIKSKAISGRMPR